jgi:MOSC domain-containing protein YiiM
VEAIHRDGVNADGQTLGTKLFPAETRRNMATSGVPLNHLVGQVLPRSTRLCEPCRHVENLTQKGVLARLIHRGGPTERPEPGRADTGRSWMS